MVLIDHSDWPIEHCWWQRDDIVVLSWWYWRVLMIDMVMMILGVTLHWWLKWCWRDDDIDQWWPVMREAVNISILKLKKLMADMTQTLFEPLNEIVGVIIDDNEGKLILMTNQCVIIDRHYYWYQTMTIIVWWRRRHWWC